MKHRRDRSNQSGWSLMELMLVIFFLSVFATMASRLLMTATRVVSDAEAAASAGTRFDSVMRELRRDVWNARSIRLDSQHVATMVGDDRASTSWRFSEPEDAVTRIVTDSSGESNEYRWSSLNANLRFSTLSHALVVHVDQGPNRHSGEIHMISQLAFGPLP